MVKNNRRIFPTTISIWDKQQLLINYSAFYRKKYQFLEKLISFNTIGFSYSHLPMKNANCGYEIFERLCNVVVGIGKNSFAFIPLKESPFRPK